MQEQVAEARDTSDATEARRLAAQRGLLALIKRVFILHGGKIAALTVWWAAVQRPGVIGWILTGMICGIHHPLTGS